jgi:hypothetical protein
LAQSATFDGKSTQYFDESRTTRQQQRDRIQALRRLTEHVMKLYVSSRNLPAVIAVEIDEDAVSRSSRWSPQVCHFMCDVELATEKALRNSQELQDAWFKLAAGETVPATIAEQVYSRVGKIYQLRGLGNYFRPSVRANTSVDRRLAA